MLERLPIVPWCRSPHPFVKWAGGKGQLLPILEQYFPKHFSTYYEPFLGGGAVFFYIVERCPRFTTILSDINEELVITYHVVKEKVEQLVKLLENHKAQYKLAPEKYYYMVRGQDPTDEVEKAARLIFLNKTCYNGLYRVNKEGKFNVPFGRYSNPKIADKENLRIVSQVLKWTNAKILPKDYQKATKDARKGDFVYFDPPYQPVSATANFTSYTDSGFSFNDQERLGRWFKELDKRGCYLLLSNSDTVKVRNIYSIYHIKTVQAIRAISCKGDRRKGHTELVVSNPKQD